MRDGLHGLAYIKVDKGQNNGSTTTILWKHKSLLFANLRQPSHKGIECKGLLVGSSTT